MPVKKFTAAYKQANPKPRHLMVFLDGTWNDENGHENDGVTTNIYRLFRALKGTYNDNDVPHTIDNDQHLALYFRGLGNDDDNGMIGSYFEGAFGAGEKRIRDNAYCHIIKHYRKGDTLSIFGFSRGAACARMLAQSLNSRGLFESLRYHYKTVKNENNGKSETVYNKFSDESSTSYPVKVNFLGIFDTVGAFGIPIDLGFSFQKVNLFKDMSIAPNVERVVHCVSIDDTREPFIPTLCNAAPHIDEVWFAGVHADIGGGYRHRELAAFPLSYMLKNMQKHFENKAVDFDDKALQALTKVDMQGAINLHYHGDGAKKDPRTIHVQENDKPVRKRPRIHRSVFELMRAEKVYVTETFHSFSKVQKILYSPRGIGTFNEKDVAVD